VDPFLPPPHEKGRKGGREGLGTASKLVESIELWFGLGTLNSVVTRERHAITVVRAAGICNSSRQASSKAEQESRFSFFLSFFLFFFGKKGPR